MADLVLAGMLNLTGLLKLVAARGQVKVNLGGGVQANLLVADPSGQTAHGMGIPVLLPPNAPVNPGASVRIVASSNLTVSVKLATRDAPLVALGDTLQGDTLPLPLWPGKVLPSTKNTGVTVGGVAVNVVGDQGITTANGGSNMFNNSGQG